MARILLIDDDDYVRSALSMALRQCGHVVTEAGNGREGLARLQHDGFDLLITDIVMPEMEGLEVLRELRRNYPALKTIAISGGGLQPGEDYLHVARLMGAGKVLAKPFSTAALRAAVDELLADGRAPAAPPVGP